MNFKSFGDYDVYTDGRVWSNKSNKFLKQKMNRYKYMEVCLYLNNKKIRYVGVHRLMGELFLPNFNNLPTVEHKDQNRLNNSLFNLKWETYSNQNYNQGMKSTNTSGVKGVSYYKNSGKWAGCMMINKKMIRELFDTKEEAILYRKELEMLSGLPYY